MNVPAARTVRALALDLHTDLANLDTYAGNTALTAALLETAENKVAIILQHLADTREAAGLTGSSMVLRGIRAA